LRSGARTAARSAGRTSRLRDDGRACGRCDRPKEPESRYALEYVRVGDEVIVTDTTDWFSPDHRPDAEAPAVEIG
jgi:hypothetical protein